MRLFGNHFLQRAGLLAQRLDLVTSCCAGGVTSQAALTGFQELLGPSAVKALGYGFAATQGGDAFLAAEPLQDDGDDAGQCRWASTIRRKWLASAASSRAAVLVTASTAAS